MFGGSGWGPYSDGPLNAVRKSILSRDGVGEENWMFMMAARVSDASAEWGKLRKEALKVVEGVDGLVLGGALVPPTDASTVKQAAEEAEEANEEEEDKEGVQDQAMVDGEQPSVKKRKIGFEIERPAVGVYDPHSHTIHCEVASHCSIMYVTNFFPFRRSVRYTTHLGSMGGCPRFCYETACVGWYENG